MQALINGLTRFTSTFTQVYKPFVTQTTCLHSVVTQNTSNLAPGGIFTTFIRNKKLRCYFPRPNERRRIKRHGYAHRLSTLPGCRIIMRRILKGRHVLSH